jgi:hypothetical protein
MRIERYVLVKGAAGLGNRMLAAMSGMAFAEVTGRTPVVDWSDPMFSNDGSNVFPRLFRCSGLSALPAESQTCDSIHPPIWCGELMRTPMQLVNRHFPESLGKYSCYRKTSANLAEVTRDEAVIVFWSWDSQVHRFASKLDRGISGLGGGSEADLLRLLARRYFVPTDLLKERLASAGHFDDLQAMIGVHVRFTDRRAPVDRILRAVERVMRATGRDEIFLATDNVQVEQVFKERFGTVHTLKKRFRPDGGPIHMDLEYHDRTGAALDALVEMFTLAACGHLVYARRSTFSYMASLLSEASPECLLDIDRTDLQVFGKRVARRVAERLCVHGLRGQ